MQLSGRSFEGLKGTAFWKAKIQVLLCQSKYLCCTSSRFRTHSSRPGQFWTEFTHLMLIGRDGEAVSQRKWLFLPKLSPGKLVGWHKRLTLENASGKGHRSDWSRVQFVLRNPRLQGWETSFWRHWRATTRPSRQRWQERPKVWLQASYFIECHSLEQWLPKWGTSLDVHGLHVPSAPGPERIEIVVYEHLVNYCSII